MLMMIVTTIMTKTTDDIVCVSDVSFLYFWLKYVGKHCQSGLDSLECYDNL